MKNKIRKILESPKIIIPSTLLVAVIIGVFIYKFVGYAPKLEINLSTQNISNKNPRSGGAIDLAFPKSGRVNAVYVKSGDLVKKGDKLASLDFMDALGALNIAKANYQKIINGATSADIDVAKKTVGTAQVNFDTVTKQQNLAVESAYRNLLNSNPEAVPVGDNTDYTAPIISGNYTLGKEGRINIKLYYSAGGVSFVVSGVANGSGIANEIIPQPIGNSGLNIKFSSSKNINVDEWTIDIPNKKASNYLQNYNAYQSALESQKRLVALAQASLDQANSALLLKISNARSEDVAAATGALSVAEGVYNNDFIYAPVDGLITTVNIGAGEIVAQNQRVISMIADNK